MNIKPFIFFGIIFLFILYGFFYYDNFIKYFPIHIIIKIFVLLLGLLAMFVPHIIKKFRDGDNIDEIKLFIINKYGKK